MRRHVSALEARKNLGELLETVYHRGDEIVVERAGKPMAVLVPLAVYQRVEQQKDTLVQELTSIWASRPSVTDPMLEEEFIQREIDLLRKEKRGEAPHAAGDA